ncbi:class I SAM-dependent methyltransferase, partial [Rhodovulum sulfidophilum]|uniref:RsmG family class I SAM-dependent methyltransferase n=1 Tax=Rhodovulum sulfidophilum TaxID=35806 RepID=UPI001924C670
MTIAAGEFSDVSRETSERLASYAALLRKWNPAINLVSRATLDELETRHFADSAQLFDL